MQLLHYTVYKITNTINGKIYIGCHQTKDIDDGYMGSGKIIKASIKKYGIENFTKEILATFDSAEQMFNEEKNLISKLSPDYNIHEGGNGGWKNIRTSNGEFKKDCEWTKHVSQLGVNKFKSLLCDTEYNKKHREKMIMGRKKWREDYKNKYGHFPEVGRPHTEEAKIKIGKANSMYQKGNGNSQYGTMWITNEMENKKIKKEDSIPEGWRKGRKL